MEKLKRTFIISNKVSSLEENTREQVKLAIKDFVNRVKAKHL